MAVALAGAGACLAACATMLGCSSKPAPALTDAATMGGKGGQGGGQGGGQDGAQGGTEAGTPAFVGVAKNCLELRQCTFACKTDTACVTRCVTQAPADAQKKFQAVQMCSTKSCPTRDTECRCMAECLFPSDCADVLDECTVGHEDPFCEANCR